MKKEINTPAGVVHIGDTIRIIKMDAKTEPSKAFPDGMDHQATAYNGKTGTVQFIDGIGQLHGTWGSLAVIPGYDTFEIL